MREHTIEEQEHGKLNRQKALKIAREEAPWASAMVKCCGGYKCFESWNDYELWMDHKPKAKRDATGF